MKPLEWIATAKKDLKAMPDEVQDNVGYALLLAQLGEKHDDTKPIIFADFLDSSSLSLFSSWYVFRFIAKVTCSLCYCDSIMHRLCYLTKPKSLPFPACTKANFSYF
jgi:hypothetical protein